MASIQKIENKGKVSYRAFVALGGKRKSKTFPNQAMAKRWAAEQEAESVADRFGLQSERKTLFDALERYGREISPSKRGYRWERVRLSALQRSPLAHMQLSSIGLDQVQEWIDTRIQQVKGGSVRRDCSLLSAVFTQCIRWKWIAENPMRYTRKPAAEKPRFRRISDSEIALLLEQLGYVEGARPHGAMGECAWALLFALETAMRMGEIWSLRGENVFEKHVHLPMTKNGTARDVPLSLRARELLSVMPSAGILLTSRKESAGVAFRKACDRAGIENLHFHDSRHEAITRLVAGGKLSPVVLARMTGHKNLNQIMTYYNESAADIADLLG